LLPLFRFGSAKIMTIFFPPNLFLKFFKNNRN